MSEVYLNTERFNSLAEKLAAIKPCMLAHGVTIDQIKLALGEHGDVWPECIRADARAHGHE